MPETFPHAIRAARLGNYDPLVELASGGMATVYVARQVGAAGFERLVVVKRVHPHLLKDRDFTDMFRDEARMCSTIRHPNVVPVIDVVEADAELFLVLEYVESVSLSALVKAATAAGAPLAPAVVSRICSDALAGLHAAHEAVDMRGQKLDIVHRDVSPQNIIVGVDGGTRLIDFGIAKAASRASVTTSGVVKGKLRYMSPEQVQQKPLDRRADVFAAGVVLYEALTGVRPFAGDDEGDIVVGILMGGAEPPSTRVSGLPPAIDAVLEKALARRDERFATAAELQEALERAIPPATARDVAAAVESLAGPYLAQSREELRSAVETRGATTAATLEPSTLEPATVVSVPRAITTRRRTVGVLIACTLVVTAAAISLAARSRARGGALPATATEAALATPDGDRPADSATATATTTTTTTTTATTIATTATATTTGGGPRKTDRPRTTPPTDLHRRNPYGAP